MKTALIALSVVALLVVGCTASSPLDFFKRKNAGDAKAKQVDKKVLEEAQNYQYIIGNYPRDWHNVPQLETDQPENQCIGDNCPGAACPIPGVSALVNTSKKAPQLPYSPLVSKKPINLPLADGKQLTVPAGTPVTIVITGGRQTTQTTITEIINEVKTTIKENNKYLLVGGVVIVALYGLVGFYTRRYGFCLLGLVSGIGVAGVTYFPWVSLVVIGLGILGTVLFVVAELRIQSGASKENKALQAEIEALRKENGILRGQIDPVVMSRLDTNLRS